MRFIRAAVAILTLVLIGTAVAPSASAAPGSKFTIPSRPGNATQLITVTATSHSATVGKLRAYEKTAHGKWRKVLGPVKAYLGTQGVGPASEFASRTPEGTFTLTEAFGAKRNPGAKLPYHRTTANDWWVSDAGAASYNTMMRCTPAGCPFNTRVSERLRTITPYYDYAVVMDVNRAPVVKNGGSAFFLHVSVGQPTAGCVAIKKKPLKRLLRWLDPAASPRIVVGVK